MAPKRHGRVALNLKLDVRSAKPPSHFLLRERGKPATMSYMKQARTHPNMLTNKTGMRDGPLGQAKVVAQRAALALAMAQHYSKARFKFANLRTGHQDLTPEVE